LVPDTALWRLVTPDNSIFPVMLVMVAAAASLIVRVRRTRGTERQQLRWFAAALAFVVLGVGTGYIVGSLVPGTSASGLAWIPAILAFASVPVAVGIAVLRYRLYDIDRIISRTLAYGSMTAILAVVFAGIIVGLQALFATVNGGSTLAVAASTLVVAALFQPLRQRIQRTVDHRFNRARYDAEQTVAGFSFRMRDEMDISTVASDLRGTVVGAVNPSSLGLWIREARP